LNDPLQALRAQLARQVGHWLHASDQLVDFGQLAAESGWHRLERYLGLALRAMLAKCVDRLKRQGAVLRAELAASETDAELARLREEVVAFRRRYLHAEAVLEFYADAINTRTNDALGTYLRACDTLAAKAMDTMLAPLRIARPPVLTYVDRGLGASILKAGLRLWDGRSISPAAAIKIVRHNLDRPTALLHEVGHQVAHLTHWTDELASALRSAASRAGSDAAAMWAGWASEVGADAFAFSLTGYAAVATLHDVLADAPPNVMRLLPGDPHPVGYLRVLLGREMCTRLFGAGPWDDLARSWVRSYPISRADTEVRALVESSVACLPEIVEAIFDRRYRAFGNRALRDLVDPLRVKPEALAELARSAGESLFKSDDWIEREALRLLATCGYRIAVDSERADETREIQRRWMHRLGELTVAA